MSMRATVKQRVQLAKLAILKSNLDQKVTTTKSKINLGEQRINTLKL